MFESDAVFHVVRAVVVLSFVAQMAIIKERLDRRIDFVRRCLLLKRRLYHPIPYSKKRRKKSERNFNESEWWRWKTNLELAIAELQQLHPDDRSPNAQAARNNFLYWYDKFRYVPRCVYAAGSS